MMQMNYEHLLIFGLVAIPVWFLFIYFWPSLLLSVYKRALLVKGSATAPSRSIRSTRSPRRFLQILSTPPPRPQKWRLLA